MISLGSHQNIGPHTGTRANFVLLTYLIKSHKERLSKDTDLYFASDYLISIILYIYIYIYIYIYNYIYYSLQKVILCYYFAALQVS